MPAAVSQKNRKIGAVMRVRPDTPAVSNWQQLPSAVCHRGKVGRYAARRLAQGVRGNKAPIVAGSSSASS